ncbi:MAG: hypothetical protein AAGE88_18275 [Actinomycetota bacterium]
MMTIRQLERLSELLCEWVRTHPPTLDELTIVAEESAASLNILVCEEIAERRRATGHVNRHKARYPALEDR